MRKHRSDVEAVRLLARDVVAPFVDGRAYPTAEWYRAAKQAGLAVRIVFSSAEDEQAPLRDLLLAHIDQQILGPDFVDADIATAHDTGHFDLGWNNYTDPEKESQILLNRVRKLSLEISDYEHRMGTNLSEYQRNKIYNSMEDLQNLIPFMKNKIVSYESSENILNEDK